MKISSRRVPTNEDLDRMVDNCGNGDANESNVSAESKCEYFEGKSVVMGLILYGFYPTT